MIEQIQRRITEDFPALRDRRPVAGLITERPPGHLGPGDGGACFFDLAVAVDADNIERLTLKSRDQFKLMRDQLHTREAPRAPEVQQHHTPAILTQGHRPAVQVDACDLGCGLADRSKSKFLELVVRQAVEKLLAWLINIGVLSIEL